MRNYILYILSSELFLILFGQINKLWGLLKKHWGRLFLAIAFLLVILDSWVRGLDWSNWAGPGAGAMTLWGRSLWDWAGLLLVPLVLAIGGFLLQRSERKTDREIAEERHKIDQQIAKEARMDKTLDDYLDAMTGFLLQENSLLKSKKDDPIRNVARTQTITVINRLDFWRNQIVFQFLQEANLISTMKEDETKTVEKPIISLAKANLQGADLQRANLQGANLQRANLEKAKLRRAFLEKADLQEAYLRGANLLWANLSEANLQETNLDFADLTYAVLSGANLQRARLSGAILLEANLQGADLQRANLQGANLQKANLQEANLQGADLDMAYLVRANLQGTNLQGANLRGVFLIGADLRGAFLVGAIFTDIYSILKKGYLEGTTMPDGTKFSKSTDLKKFTEATEEE